MEKPDKCEANLLQLQLLLSTEPELRNPGDLSQIQNYLLNYPFFVQLYRDYHINNIVDCAIYFNYQHFTAGQIIFSENQPAQKLYVLLIGEVSIFKQDQLIRKYTEGVFEECCLIERRKHDTSAVSSQESHVLYIDYQIYSGLLATFREKKRIAVVSFLQIQKSFKTWNKAQLMSLSYFIHELELNEGDVIFKAGDPCDKIYVVHDGKILLKTKDFQILSAGEVVGLEDVEKNRCRGAMCVAQSNCTLLYIFKHD